MTTKTNTPRPGDVPGSRDRVKTPTETFADNHGRILSDEAWGPTRTGVEAPRPLTEDESDALGKMINSTLLESVSEEIASLREPKEFEEMTEAVDRIKAWPLDNGGTKHDAGKVRIELFAPEMIEGVSEVLTFGATKYGDRNWERGMDWSRPYGALMRHMFAWWRGEKTDPETGKSHLWHAGCCLMFLIAYEERGTGRDDRP